MESNAPAGGTPAGALSGVRVVDLTQFVLGPYATQMLGDLGADVIKVEEPSGDRQRAAGKSHRTPSMGPLHMAFNRNKRSLTLDLKGEPGKRALRRLVATADIFIHNMRPQSIASLGFAYADVAAIKPDIVYVEAMGYDDAGPYAGLQAFDDLIQCAAGACGLEQLINPAATFRPLPGLFADKTCGLFATIATLAALRHKETTGEGQYVAVPMLETFTGFLMAEHLYGETFVPPTGRFGHPSSIAANRRPFPTRDGWLMVFPASQKQAARFMELGGVPNGYESELFTSQTTPQGRLNAYFSMIETATAAHTTAEWLSLAAANSIPVMRANTTQGIFEDEQLSKTLFEERELAGDGTYRAMKPGLRFARTPAAIHRDPPRLGEHNDELLAEFGDFQS